MQQTFANLPSQIEKAIEQLLTQEDNPVWISSVSELHDRYVNREKNKDHAYMKDLSDALAYLALRLPATYAQVFGVLLSVQEVLPSWKPKTLLDIGSGPGTGVWAAQSIWSELADATCIDRDKNLFSLGKKISSLSQLPVDISWKQQDIRKGIDEDDETYDIVVIANVFNELRPSDSEKLLGQAYNKCNGVLIIVESGTPFGSKLVQSTAQKLAHTGVLIAPYIANSFVANDDYWLHFSQKFIRPELQRRIRQHMRKSSLAASDWEDAKYSYVAISKIPSEDTSWGRCVGSAKIQKGFLEISLLTGDTISQIKVMKRDKERYAFAKDLKWGQLIKHKENIC